jgi:hypothetical protein
VEVLNYGRTAEERRQKWEKNNPYQPQHTDIGNKPLLPSLKNIIVI